MKNIDPNITKLYLEQVLLTENTIPFNNRFDDIVKNRDDLIALIRPYHADGKLTDDDTKKRSIYMLLYLIELVKASAKNTFKRGQRGPSDSIKMQTFEEFANEIDNENFNNIYVRYSQRSVGNLAELIEKYIFSIWNNVTGVRRFENRQLVIRRDDTPFSDSDFLLNAQGVIVNLIDNAIKNADDVVEILNGKIDKTEKEEDTTTTPGPRVDGNLMNTNVAYDITRTHRRQPDRSAILKQQIEDLKRIRAELEALGGVQLQTGHNVVRSYVGYLNTYGGGSDNPADSQKRALEDLRLPIIDNKIKELENQLAEISRDTSQTETETDTGDGEQGDKVTNDYATASGFDNLPPLHDTQQGESPLNQSDDAQEESSSFDQLPLLHT